MGISPEITTSLGAGIDAFHQAVEDNYGFLNNAARSLDEAARKGFYIQWYKAMGGDKDTQGIALMGMDELRDLAETQTEEAADAIVRKIRGELPDIDDAGLDKLGMAMAMYAESERLGEYPEVIGAAAAARVYAAERGNSTEVFIKAVRTILVVAATVAIVTSAHAIITAISTGILTMMVVGVMTKAVNAELARELVPTLIEEADTEYDARKQRNRNKNLA